MSIIGAQGHGVEFRLLGPLEALVDGDVVPIGSGRQRSLLALLLLHLGEVVSRERIIDELWGERSPPSVVKALQVHISQLRKVLPPGLVVTRPPGYVIEAPPAALDVARFETAVAAGRAALERGDAQEAAVTLRGALALWRGPALGDVAFEGFAAAEATRLDDLRLSALEARIDADLERGGRDLVSELEALARRTPLREHVWRQLMLALYREDRQAEALAAFQEARRTLVTELGIEPGPALHELNDAILAQDAALRPSATAGHAPAADLVGREAEQALLIDALRAMLGGSGAVCLLSGEAGVGKSRLIEWLTDQAVRHGALVVSGRCWEAGGAPAYWPWIEALRAYESARGPDAMRAVAGEGLGRLLPELAADPDAEDTGARFRLFESVAATFAVAAAADPLIVVLEDLHAADAPSLLLLEFVARRVTGARLIVVATYREDEVNPTLARTAAELARQRATLPLHLTALGDDDVARLVAQLTGDAVNEQTLRRIVSETAGNPLFVVELVRLLAGGDDGFPDELRAVIARRAARLSDPARRALVAASALGREFTLGVLTSVAGLGRSELLDLLEEAVNANLVETVAGAPGRRRFAHGLVRDALYGELDAAGRRRLHTLAGTALEASYRDELAVHAAEIAHHFAAAADAGGAPAPAVRLAWLAGRQARRSLAYEEAARQFEIALALAEELPAGERCDLLLELGDAQARAGDTRASRLTFREAAAVAGAAGLAERRARAALGHCGRFLWERATEPDMLPLLEAATDALAEEHPQLRAQLLARRAAALRPGFGMPLSRRGEADELGRQAVEIARGSGDPAALAYALEGALRAAWRPGETDGNLRVAAEIEALARVAKDPEREYAGKELALLAEWELGHGEAIDARLADLERVGNILRQPAQRWERTALHAVRAISRGDLDEAVRLVEAAAELGEAADIMQARISRTMHVFGLARARGPSSEAAGEVEKAAREFPAYGVLSCAWVHVLAAAGETAAARRALQPLAAGEFAAVPFAENWIFSVALLAEACALLGDDVHARGLRERLLPHATSVAMGPPDGTTDAVATQLGELSELLGEAGAAREHYALAVEVNGRVGALPARDRAAEALERLR